MQVHYLPDPLPVFQKAILTIGTFDGVHSGHCQVIHQLKSEAKSVGGETVIITFDPHPRKVLGRHGSELKLINTTAEKIKLLEEQDIDHLVIVPFTREFANQPARDYVEKFLAEKFHPHTIIIGYDHQFGHNREGNYLLLEEMKTEFGFEVKEIPEQILNSVIISSTRVRKSITEGNMDEANLFLGYPYFFEGVVVEGNKLGRTIGYPTANIQVNSPDKLVPGHGVYAVTVEFLSLKNPLPHVDQPVSGMMNIGVRPTVGGTTRVIEVNLFEFDEDIYGATLRVYVHRRLRGEEKFNGLEALKEQLAKDKINAINALTELQANNLS
jgi:riboflavin kinase/FMN adenylyltransferase